MKPKNIYLILIILIQLSAFSQIRKSDLFGVWIATNNNNSFITNDTIRFYREAESKILNSCHKKIWKISKTKIVTLDTNCSKIGIVSKSEGNIKIKKTDFGQVLEISLTNRQVVKFRIVSKNKKYLNTKGMLKQIELIRFDKLSDKKLIKHIDSLIFKVMKYNIAPTKSIDLKKKISNTNPRINPFDNYNPKPLIIVNGNPIGNKNILKKILLVETYSITHLSKQLSVSLYGHMTKNGVIIISTSKKAFRKAKKSYSKK